MTGLSIQRRPIVESTEKLFCFSSHNLTFPIYVELFRAALCRSRANEIQMIEFKFEFVVNVESHRRSSNAE